MRMLAGMLVVSAVMIGCFTEQPSEGSLVVAQDEEMATAVDVYQYTGYAQNGIAIVR
jgi:hypothetical protein